MKKQCLSLVLIANSFSLSSTITTPITTTPVTPITAKTAPAEKKSPSKISIPLAYDVRIMNTSPVPGTLTSVTVAYGINGQTYATKKMIPAGQNTIPANQQETLLNHQNMLSFGASITITSPEANAAATFQGITAIEVDGQELNLTTTLSRQFGSSIIYIANIAQPGQTPSWKLTTAPVTPPAPKQTVTLPPVTKKITPTVGTNNAMHAATARLIEGTPKKAPALPAKPTTPMPKLAKIKPQTPVSMASGSAIKALNATTTTAIPA